MLDALAALRAATKARNEARDIAAEAELHRDALREQLKGAEASLASASGLVAEEQQKVDAAKAVLDQIVSEVAE